DEPEEPEAPAESQKPAEPETPVEPEPQNEQDRTQVVPPVTSGQPQAAAASAEQTEPTQNEDSQRGPTPIPPPAARSEETPVAGYAIQYPDEPQGSAVGRWLAGLLLVAVLVGAVIIGFYFLGIVGDDEPQETEA